MLDKKAIKHDADPVLVAEALGMVIHRRGNRNLVLCPFHADNKIGSCYIDHNGLICYSCGARADVFGIAQRVMNVSFGEALSFVADLCGGAEYYDEEAASESMSGFIPRNIAEELNLFTPPIYIDIDCVDDYYTAKELREGTQIIKEVYDSDAGEMIYLIQELADPNPLLSLYRNNSEMYQSIVDQRCQFLIDCEEENLRNRAFLCTGQSGVEQLIAETKKVGERYALISSKYGGGTAHLNQHLYASLIVNSLWEKEDGAF